MIAMFGMVIGGHLIHLGIGWYDEQYTAESALALGIQLFVLVGLALETYWADRDGDVDEDTGEAPDDSEPETPQNAMQTEPVLK